jgi:hypothetical protein
MKRNNKKVHLILLLSFLFSFSCNHIETADTLSKTDIKYIQTLGLLGSDEKIYKFFSEYKKKVAGNFFTDKRLAKYWIDEQKKEKNRILFAYYEDIKSIDTVYDAGLTYCPYMLITKSDGTQFKVCADGEREEVKSFFEDAIKQWQQHNPAINLRR